MHCSFCGFGLDPDMRYCPRCGNATVWASAETIPVPPLLTHPIPAHSHLGTFLRIDRHISQGIIMLLCLGAILLLIASTGLIIGR